MLIKKINLILDFVLTKNEQLHQHLESTALYSFALAKALNLNPKEMETAYFAGLTHDIGKVFANESDNEEQHVVNGNSFLKFIDGFENLSEIILHHHEQWDGTGYPHNLIGEDIPLVSRVVLIASSYDNFRNVDGLTHEEAISKLKEGSGKTYDPNMIVPFIGIIEKEELF